MDPLVEQRFNELDAKVKSAKGMELAEKSFKTILDADIHIDNKAGRILAAIAFLTAAASGIFTKAFALIGSKDRPPAMTVHGLDVSLLAFSAFLFCVLLGAILYLATLGPALNLASGVKGHESQVKSLLFFESIGSLTSKDTWLQHWGWTKPEEGSPTKDAADHTTALTEEMEVNLLYEAYLIAQKIRTKILFMSLGSFLFKIGLVFLAPMVASLFTTNAKWGWIALLLGAAALLFDLALESWKRPPFKLGGRAIALLMCGLVCLGAVVLGVSGAW